MNKVIIIGHVGQDPEMRYTPNGSPVTTFSVATSHKYTDGQGVRKEETTWFNVSCWGKLAEIVSQYVGKGQQIYVEGRLALRMYTKRDNSTGASLDVHALTVEFLGRPKDEGQAQAQAEDAATP